MLLVLVISLSDSLFFIGDNMEDPKPEAGDYLEKNASRLSSKAGEHLEKKASRNSSKFGQNNDIAANGLWQAVRRDGRLAAFGFWSAATSFTYGYEIAFLGGIAGEPEFK